MNEQIWKYIAELSTPGFFVTARRVLFARAY